MKPPAYRYESDGSFVVENYNRASLFSSFLPGIAGEEGVPLWAFYVNRGQAVTSFGARNKDGAIAEFFPADRAYQTVTLRGFRTFLKVKRGGRTVCHEPFQSTSDDGVVQRLIIRPYEVAVEETHEKLGIRVRAVMFTLPQASLPALLRTVTVDNLQPSPVAVEFVDGLPLLLSYGLNQWCVKYMSRTMEAFTVVNENDSAPFLRLKVFPADSEKVVPVVAGNFFAGWLEGGRAARPLEALTDPRTVFGLREDFVRPEAFFDGPVPKGRVPGNRNPAGLLKGRASISGKGHTVWHSLYGRADSIQAMKDFVKTVTPAFFHAKRAENADLLQDLTSTAFSATGLPILDAYARQSFLDNGLRGGFPRTIPGGRTIYLFGRKHGDPERDYNDFFLQDSPWSEGNGDFRDMLQNRRVDLFFNPDVGDRNLRYFFGLIQPDGYNPLILRNTRFVIKDLNRLNVLWRDRGAKGDPRAEFGKSFKFADLWNLLTGAVPDDGRADLAAEVLSLTDEVEDAEFEKGYWSDHWTYLVDMLENFRGVFPDRLAALLLDDASYPFYDGCHFVQPRSRKYQLTADGVRQYGAVKYEKEKDLLIKSRAETPHRVRDGHGKGEPVLTTLLGKILTLVLNKTASLDPFCVGVEMEADRPGWCDAMNGLPGLLGSSVNETLELLRLVRFTRETLESSGRSGAVSLPRELVELFLSLKTSIDGGSWDSEPLRFWEETHTAKEFYREKVFYGFDGVRRDVLLSDVTAFLSAAEKVLILASSRAKRDGKVVTYFSHEAVRYEALPEPSFVRVLEFRQKPVPLFLEGFVHALRTVESPEAAREIHKAVRGTELFDRELGMYRLNVPLGKDPFELGRVGIFSYGWLENGSIFLHMHYKYVLEMARRGLLDEFYKDWKELLVPFQDPRRYGRNILENTSFIASSGYKDKEDRGKAFVARLSGSTVEFLHLWSFLLFGERPFVWKDGALSLAFRPNLKAELFSTKARTVHPDGPDAPGVDLPKDTLAFRFLGRVLVVYHNPSRRDTFGSKALAPVRHEIIFSDGSQEAVEGSSLPSAQAKAVREERVTRLDVYFG